MINRFTLNVTCRHEIDRKIKIELQNKKVWLGKNQNKYILAGWWKLSFPEKANQNFSRNPATMGRVETVTKGLTGKPNETNMIE